MSLRFSSTADNLHDETEVVWRLWSFCCIFFSRGSTSSRRLTADRDRESDRDRDRDRDSFSRWRDRQYFGPRRWLESALRDSTWDKDSGNFVLFYFQTREINDRHCKEQYFVWTNYVITATTTTGRGKAELNHHLWNSSSWEFNTHSQPQQLPLCMFAFFRAPVKISHFVHLHITAQELPYWLLWNKCWRILWKTVNFRLDRTVLKWPLWMKLYAYLWKCLSIAHKMFLEWHWFKWKLQRGRKHTFGLIQFCSL